MPLPSKIGAFNEEAFESCLRMNGLVESPPSRLRPDVAATSGADGHPVQSNSPVVTRFAYVNRVLGDSETRTEFTTCRAVLARGLMLPARDRDGR